VRLRAAIARNGQLLYDQISPPGFAVPWMDTTLITLPSWNAGALPSGRYEMEYTVSADEDAYPHDNVMRKEFWVNDSIFSHAAFDPVSGQPIVGGGLRPLNSSYYRWCQVMQSPNASAYEAKALSFATMSNLNTSLIGHTVEVSLSNWNDPIINGGMTFDDIQVLEQQTYTYAENLQYQMVTVPFPAPVPLLNNQKYLACIDVSSPDVFIATDGVSDYMTNYTAYPDGVFFPAFIDGQWYSSAFGSESVPVIAVNLQEPMLVSLSGTQLGSGQLTVFPNPADHTLHIRSDVTLSALVLTDAIGREAWSDANAPTGTIEVSSIPAGVYLLMAVFTDGQREMKRIVVR